MSLIKLNSGKMWDFANPKVEQVDIQDIMHNLAKEQRFSNCLDHDWSVLQHSLLVATIVKASNGSARQMYQALMHDIPEAYLKDVPTPLKEMLRDYNKFYVKTALVLEHVYSVKLLELDPMVKTADKTAMLIEDLLFSHAPSSWHSFTLTTYYALDETAKGKIHAAVTWLHDKPAYRVKQRFFRTFKQLQKAIGEEEYESNN